MKLDVHIIKTKKSIKAIQKILKNDIFGNYNTVDVITKKKEFGIMLFKYEDYMVLKLDYDWFNYESISDAIVNNLGPKLKCEYWVCGVVVEYPEAFITYYTYDRKRKTMSMNCNMVESDGKRLTPRAKERWGIDPNGVWSKMTFNLDWENLRQRLMLGQKDNSFISMSSFSTWEKQWESQFPGKKPQEVKLCDMLYFVAIQDIEQYRVEPSGLKMETKRLGQIKLEDNKRTITRDTEDGGKILIEHELDGDGNILNSSRKIVKPGGNA